MTRSLSRLVYYSRNRIARDPDALAVEIRQILAASRTNNARVGVTGALMFNAGCFGQVLEGPQDAVEAVFERIQKDLRHGEVSLLDVRTVDAPTFPSWSMGFVGASVEEAVRFGHVASDSGFDPSRMSGEALFDALRVLALQEEGA
ncbi:MAG: blue light sensor protein [Caulobacterales bacterium 68-7]|nr:MAG: blue light sensor protein [Caulobacterales bacterium 68-7]